MEVLNCDFWYTEYTIQQKKRARSAFYIVICQIQFIATNILAFIHIFSILDFENYYKNWFLFLFSILIKLFDHEIVNCEIIHDVSMLIYILTTEILFVTKCGINQKLKNYRRKVLNCQPIVKFNIVSIIVNWLLMKLKTFWLKYKNLR